jgi:hypothetical protein
MKKVATAAVACALVMALSSTTAQAGSGWQFKAATYPVTEKGEATNIHGFEITGAISICKKATFDTGEEGAPNPTKPQETLEVHPIYTECETEESPVMKAKVLTTGCNYVLHSAAPATKNGTVDIVCQPGKQIEVVNEGLENCVIRVGTRAGLKTIEYVNAAGPPGTVKVNAELTGIHYKVASGCGLALQEGSTGDYREGEEFAGVLRLAPAGHPATAVFKGFNEHSEPDSVEVAASPHWYKNGAMLADALPTPIVFTGTSTDLKLVSGIGEIHCKTVGGAVVENTEGDGFGKAQATDFYSCAAPQCEAAVKEKFGTSGRGEIRAENVPSAGQENSSEGWELSLVESGSPLSSRVRMGEEWSTFPSGGQNGHESPPGMTRIDVICSVPSTHAHISETFFEGALEPEIGEAFSGNLNGTSAAHPSTLRYSGAAAGSLHSEAGGTGSLTGSTRYLGYTALEVISVGK